MAKDDVKVTKHTEKTVDTPTPPEPATADYVPIDLRTEQEKGTVVDPVNPPVEPEKAEVLDIPAKQPYPTGG